MIADMPKYVLKSMPNAKMTGYADDSTVYAQAKNISLLKTDLEMISSRMISFFSVLALS